MDMQDIFSRLMSGGHLTSDEAHGLLLDIASGSMPETQVAALLSLLPPDKISVDELIGFRRGLLETGLHIGIDCPRYIDIVGTGGDGKNTFNISTAACFVVAGAGHHVAKHGNYAATSVSGASNVLEHLGARFTSDPSRINRSITESGVAYLHAPLFATAMKTVAPVRRSLPFATFFNLLGPLVNPSQPPCQLLGVARLDQQRLYHHVLDRLGLDYAIVTSTDGYDEVSLTADFLVVTPHYERIFSAAQMGLRPTKADELHGGTSVADAAETFLAVLENRSTDSQRDVVVANAAFALQALEPGMEICEAVSTARESIESGRAHEAFRRFIDINR